MKRTGITKLGAAWITLIINITTLFPFMVILSIWGNEKFKLADPIIFSIFAILGFIYLLGFYLFKKKIIKWKHIKYIYPNRKPTEYKDMFYLNVISLFFNVFWLGIGLITLLFFFKVFPNDSSLQQNWILLFLGFLWFFIGLIGLIFSILTLAFYYQFDSKLWKYIKYLSFFSFVFGTFYSVYETFNYNDQHEKQHEN
ncbi:hypothetical protein EELLY_v1c05280 [Entomoplasma ellychniae]|uniref:Uncharacterized protein n=1 Tax=Entomoplasma ellychniae TaxID=2114 RepID=A0A8E2UCY4_9MOLU|nr:hypothetical protein [Entomoplasma ellychniae]PPE04847.1 hypothetical protein EELLY_v1c05280 [Entomoplasma ellychniae]